MTKKSNPPRSILAEAADVVAERGKRYGSPMANHNRTAQLWGAYLGVELTAADVCKLNILQKLSRDRHQQNRDNLVDVAGYVENALLAEPGGYGDAPAATEPADTLEGERVAHDVTKRAFATAHADAIALRAELRSAQDEATALRLDLGAARADREALRRSLTELTLQNDRLRKFAQIHAACGRPVTTMVDKAVLPPVDLKLPMPPTQPPKPVQHERDCPCARCSVGGDLRR